MVERVIPTLTMIKANLPEIVFGLFCARMIIQGASVGDAIALVSIVGIYAYSKFLNKNQTDQYTRFKKDLDDLKGSIQSVKLSQGITTRKVGGSSEQGQAKRYF